MTLGVMIHYNNGVVIVIDKKNTHIDVTATGLKDGEMIKKYLIMPKIKYVIVCAGSTELFQHMFAKFKSDPGITKSNLKENIQRYLLEDKNAKALIGTAPNYNVADIITLIVIREKNNVISTKLNAHLEIDDIEVDGLTTIGSIQLHNQLKRMKINSSKLTEKEAILLGISIISYTAETDKTIGPPSSYGVSVIVFPRSGKISVDEKDPSNIENKSIFSVLNPLINGRKVII